MSRGVNARFALQTLKEIIDIGVFKRLTCAMPAKFDEEMIGFDLLGMDHDQVIKDLIYQLTGYIDNAATGRGLDFGIINEWASILDTQLTATNIDVFNPQRQGFSDAD